MGPALRLSHGSADLPASAAPLLPARLVGAHVPVPFWRVPSTPASRHDVCLYRRGRRFPELPATLRSRRVEVRMASPIPTFLQMRAPYF